MRKSMEYAFGGACFVFMGIAMALGSGVGPNLGMFIIYTAVAGTTIASVGVYWLVRAVAFYNTERKIAARAS